MQVAQRATSATTASSASGAYDTIDRLKIWEDTDGAYTSEQSTTAPDGFGNSVKFQVTTADTSLSSGQYACIAQIIEGQNAQNLSYGTNAAKDVTVSFYVRSNKTGTYGFSLEKTDSTRYIFVKEFTIDTADTWERKIITIPPDSNIKASGGAIDNDNGPGLRVFIWLASGSTYHGTNNVWNTNTSYFTTSNQVNWMDSTSNNFYLTGFQLEVGSQASPFEHEPVGATKTKCERYYWNTNQFNNRYVTAIKHGGNWYCSFSAPTTMRENPTPTANGGSTNSFRIWDGDAAESQSGTVSISAGASGAILVVYGASIGSNGEGGLMTFGDGTNADRLFVALDAEL